MSPQGSYPPKILTTTKLYNVRRHLFAIGFIVKGKMINLGREKLYIQIFSFVFTFFL